MSKIVTVFTNAMGALSVVMLIKHGVMRSDFVAPLEVILDYYESLTNFLFGWLGLYLSAALNSMLNWVDYRVDLQRHWKDVFVLLWLYFGGDAKNAWGGDWVGAKRTAIIRLAVGGAIALLGAVCAGVVPIGRGWSDVLILFFPVLAIISYRLWFSFRFASERAREGFVWREQFFTRLAMVRDVALVSVPFVLFGALAHHIAILLALPVPALPLFALLVVVLAAYHLILGAANAGKVRKESETWLQACKGQGNTQLGIAMFQVIFAAVVILLLNAGLSPFF